MRTRATSVSKITHRGRQVFQTGAFAMLAQASYRPIDVMMIGDSNQLFSPVGDPASIGFDHGLSLALCERYGMYATPLTSFSTSGGLHNIGHTTGITAPNPFTTTGGPAFVENIRHPFGYAYMANPISNASGNLGADVSLANIGVNDQIRAHIGYAQFSGGGTFTPVFRNGGVPFNVLLTGSAVNTNGADSFLTTTLTLSPGTRNHPLAIGLQFSGTPALVPPVCILDIRMENLTRTSGIALSTRYAAGGQSLWDMASDVKSHSDIRTQTYLDRLTYLQRLRGFAPKLVIYINSALNDRNEGSIPTQGPSALNTTNASTTTAGYIDNFLGIKNKFDAAWTALGYNINNLTYLFVPSHPISNPDDATLMSYRTAAEQYALTDSRVSVVNLLNLTNYTYMLSAGWYNNAGADTIHLDLDGYVGIGRLIAALPTIPVVESAPVNISPPTVSVSGNTATANIGIWSATPEPTFSYQWIRNGVDIVGANSSNYSIPDASLGAAFSVRVTASNIAGSANTTSSGSYVGPLDIVTNSIRAFSVRRLSSIYTGPALRVRRTSDNTEANVGFTSTGDLDTTALTSFIGASDAHVVTWFDQSPSAINMTQSTTTNQPRIAVAGSVLTVTGGKPTVDFTGTQRFNLVSPNTIPRSMACSTVGAPGPSTNSRSLMSDTAGSRHYLVVNNGTDNVSAWSSVFGTTVGTWAPGELASFFVEHVSASAHIGKNGASLNNTGRIITLDIGSIGSSVSGSIPFGDISELVFLPSSWNSTNRQVIERSQGTHFGITIA